MKNDSKDCANCLNETIDDETEEEGSSQTLYTCWETSAKRIVALKCTKQQLAFVIIMDLRTTNVPRHFKGPLWVYMFAGPNHNSPGFATGDVIALFLR